MEQQVNASKLTIVISDIHIANNKKTDWYQKDIHEPFLIKVLEYTI